MGFGDLISRQAAIDAINKLDYTPGEWAVKGITLCKEAIKALPSAHPETCEYWDDESDYCALYRPSAVLVRKKGRWINDNGLYRCSSCNQLWAEWWAASKPIERMKKEAPYCPMCGSYNGEGSEDE